MLSKEAFFTQLKSNLIEEVYDVGYPISQIYLLKCMPKQGREQVILVRGKGIGEVEAFCKNMLDTNAPHTLKPTEIAEHCSTWRFASPLLIVDIAKVTGDDYFKYYKSMWR